MKDAIRQEYPQLSPEEAHSRANAMMQEMGPLWEGTIAKLIGDALKKEVAKGEKADPEVVKDLKKQMEQIMKPIYERCVKKGTIKP